MTGRYPPFGPGGEHTIDLTFDETEQQNRLWGIPLVGLWVRWIILIPHFVVLFFIGIVFAFISWSRGSRSSSTAEPPTGSSAGWAASTAGSTACMRTRCC